MPAYSKPRAYNLPPARKTNEQAHVRAATLTPCEAERVSDTGRFQPGAAGCSVMGSTRGALGVAMSFDDAFESCIAQAGGLGSAQVMQSPTKHVLPAGIALRGGDFILHGGKGVEKQLTDVDEKGGVAGRDAVASHHGKEPAERLVDGGGGGEILDQAEEFGGDSAGVGLRLKLLPQMLGTERWVVTGPKHAAAAAIGVSVVAAIIGFE